MSVLLILLEEVFKTTTSANEPASRLHPRNEEAWEVLVLVAIPSIRISSVNEPPKYVPWIPNKCGVVEVNVWTQGPPPVAPNTFTSQEVLLVSNWNQGPPVPSDPK